MKSKLFFGIIFLLTTSIMAQEESSNFTFRPGKGAVSLEMDFLPFSENGPVNLQNFRGRYFLAENLALRAGFNFDHKRLKDEQPFVYYEEDNRLMEFDKFEMKSTLWGITSGIEYHLFTGTRVSPYVGFEVGFETKSSEYKDDLHYLEYNYPGVTLKNIEKEIENGWHSMELVMNQWGDPYYRQAVVERSFTAIKANIVAGADIYFLKHFYAGTELGLGYKTIKFKEVSVKEDNVLTLKFPVKKENIFGFNFNKAIRIGFWF
jgi:hypothetical protein